MKQLCTFLVCVALVAIVRLPFGPLSGDSLKEIEEAARSRGVPLQIGAAVTRFPTSVEASSLGLLIPTKAFPIPVTIDAVTARLRALSLFLLRSEVEVNSKLYGGTVAARITAPLFGSTFDASVHGGNLDLSTHPLFELYGVQLELGLSGKLSGDRAGPFPLSNGELQVQLRRGAVSGETVLPLGMKIPAIADLEGDARAVLRDSELSLHEARIVSSLGVVEGSGTFRLNAQGLVDAGEASFTVDLTDEGKRIVGGYLALAARADVRDPAKSWEASLALTPAAPPKWTVRPKI